MTDGVRQREREEMGWRQRIEEEVEKADQYEYTMVQFVTWSDERRSEEGEKKTRRVKEGKRNFNNMLQGKKRLLITQLKFQMKRKGKKKRYIQDTIFIRE